MRRGLLCAVVFVLAACRREPVARLELIEPPATAEIAPMIGAEVARASHDGKRLVVYVGASWCEPCRWFHDAATSGQLDATFGDLRLLVFDADRDAAALRGAGYRSELIPLFALPRADGMASGRHIEGSIKGEGAVGQITPRLQELLGPAPAE